MKGEDVEDEESIAVENLVTLIPSMVYNNFSAKFRTVTVVQQTLLKLVSILGPNATSEIIAFVIRNNTGKLTCEHTINVTLWLRYFGCDTLGSTLSLQHINFTSSFTSTLALT